MVAKTPKYMNVEEFERSLASSGLDAVIAVSLENVYYTSNAFIVTQRLIPDRLAFNILPTGGKPTMVICGIEESMTRAESWIEDIRTYVEFKESPVQALASVLQDLGLSKARLGIEMEYLAAKYFAELTRLLPEARFEAADLMMEKVRAIKTPAEQELLGRAARVTEKAIADAFAAARIGDTEKSIADRMMVSLLTEGGADGTLFTVLGAAEYSKHAHHVPGSKPVLAGETVRVDVGAYFASAYPSDVARTVGVGTVSPRQREIYRTLRDVQRRTIASMKPGVRACDVFEVCRRGFEEAGFPFNFPHCGHGMGLKLHEYPMIMPSNPDPLRPGMIINIEPLVVDPETGAYHIEDLALITEGDPIILSDYADTSEMFAISS